MEYMSHQDSIAARPLRPEIFYRQRSPAGLKVRLRLAVLVACQLSSPVRLHPALDHTAARSERETCLLHGIRNPTGHTRLSELSQEARGRLRTTSCSTRLLSTFTEP